MFKIWLKNWLLGRRDREIVERQGGRHRLSVGRLRHGLGKRKTWKWTAIILVVALYALFLIPHPAPVFVSVGNSLSSILFGGSSSAHAHKQTEFLLLALAAFAVAIHNIRKMRSNLFRLGGWGPALIGVALLVYGGVINLAGVMNGDAGSVLWAALGLIALPIVAIRWMFKGKPGPGHRFSRMNQTSRD